MPPIDVENVRSRLKDADSLRGKAKGDALEQVIVEVFSAIPGMQVASRQQKNDAGTEEIDVGFRNFRADDGLREFGPEVLVECKNWSKPVGSIEVGWFVQKMQHAHQDVGVLVAAEGVAGLDEWHDAKSIVATARLVPPTVVLVVVTREELQHVTSGELLAAVLDRKLYWMKVHGKIFEPVAGDPPGWQEDGRQGEGEPEPASRNFRRGLGAISEAVERAREAVVGEMVDQYEEDIATEKEPESIGEASDQLRSALRTAHLAYERATAQDEDDENFARVRSCLIEAGAACVHLVAYGRPTPVHLKKWLAANSNQLSDAALSPRLGGRLWEVLVGYFADEIEGEQEMPLTRAVLSLVDIIVEQVIAIDEYQATLSGPGI